MMTSATEVLRHMLDERGVEWWPMHDAEAGYREDRDTEFLVYGCKHVAHEWGCRLQVDMLTPEQAVAATLGNGECENISDPPEGFYCSSCGWGDFAEPSHLLTKSKFTDNDGGPNYCPNCGKAVKR